MLLINDEYDVFCHCNHIDHLKIAPRERETEKKDAILNVTFILNKLNGAGDNM